MARELKDTSKVVFVASSGDELLDVTDERAGAAVFTKISNWHPWRTPPARKCCLPPPVVQLLHYLIAQSVNR